MQKEILNIILTELFFDFTKIDKISNENFFEEKNLKNKNKKSLKSIKDNKYNNDETDNKIEINDNKDKETSKNNKINKIFNGEEINKKEKIYENLKNDETKRKFKKDCINISNNHIDSINYDKIRKLHKIKYDTSKNKIPKNIDLYDKTENKIINKDENIKDCTEEKDKNTKNLEKDLLKNEIDVQNKINSRRNSRNLVKHDIIIKSESK